MKRTIEIAAVSTLIHAKPSDVFATLVTPELIREYLFGTEATSEWKVGSVITFTGEWQGKRYHDKGKILSIQPDTLLRHTFWSSLSGKADKPENYVTVTYTIEEKGDLSELVITQSGVQNEKELRHLEDNWMKVAEGIKRVAESL